MATITGNFKVADKLIIPRVDDTARMVEALSSNHCDFELNKRGGILREMQLNVKAQCSKQKEGSCPVPVDNIENVAKHLATIRNPYECKDVGGFWNSNSGTCSLKKSE